MTDDVIVMHETYEAVYGPRTICAIFLRPPLPEDFAHRLLNELLAVARPVGLGKEVARGMRQVSIDEVVAAGVEEARSDPNRADRQRPDGLYLFDYVAGYRIKVQLYPNGLEPTEGTPLSLVRPGWTMVSSFDFDGMYGAGTLERLVRIAAGK